MSQKEASPARASLVYRRLAVGTFHPVLYIKAQRRMEDEGGWDGGGGMKTEKGHISLAVADRLVAACFAVLSR